MNPIRAIWIEMHAIIVPKTNMKPINIEGEISEFDTQYTRLAQLGIEFAHILDLTSLT